MSELITFSILGLMLMVENTIPLISIDKNYRWKHVTCNLAINFSNLFIIYVIFLFLPLVSFETRTSYSLLNILKLPYFIETLIAVLIYDLFTYTTHFLYHKIPFLWRFHRAHHTDNYVDATTTLRRHFVEIIFSDIISIFIIFPILGFNLGQLLIYKTILIIVGIFHHSNIFLSEKVDNFLNLIIVSPNMHKVHHSNIQVETDSNYGNILSLWDKVFKTYKFKENISGITYGLKEFPEPSWQSITGIIKTPFT